MGWLLVLLGIFPEDTTTKHPIEHCTSKFHWPLAALPSSNWAAPLLKSIPRLLKSLMRWCTTESEDRLTSPTKIYFLSLMLAMCNASNFLRNFTVITSNEILFLNFFSYLTMIVHKLKMVVFTKNATFIKQKKKILNYQTSSFKI